MQIQDSRLPSYASSNTDSIKIDIEEIKQHETNIVEIENDYNLLQVIERNNSIP